MSYFTYVLYSNKFDEIYVGQTSDLLGRLEQHNLGLSKSTKRYVPWNLIYSEEFETRSEAMRREKKLKSQKGREFIRKVILKQF